MSPSTARPDGSAIVWPWFAAGFLMPFSEEQLSRWMPPYLAAALAFIVLFTAAGMLVAHSEGRHARSLPRIVAGSVAGAAVASGLRYLFP